MREGSGTTLNVFVKVLGPIAALTIGFLLQRAYAYSIADRVRVVFADMDEGLQTMKWYQREVVRLKSENVRITTENTYYRNFTQENNRLREMLNFKNASPYKLQACRVVGRDPANWWNSLSINVGWSDDAGIVSDLPVVTPRGVVGKTGVVWPSVTEVILIVNSNCKVAGALETSRERGIVVGEGAKAKGTPQAKMKFIARDAQLGVGERVFTSGLGGVFPPGLFLGTVAEVPPLSSSLNFGLYREIRVDPALDLTQLDELFVIVGSRTP